MHCLRHLSVLLEGVNTLTLRYVPANCGISVWLLDNMSNCSSLMALFKMEKVTFSNVHNSGGRKVLKV